MMTHYIIQRLSSKNIDHTEADPLANNINWPTISALNIATFPWYKAGSRQETQVKLCCDDTHLFIQFIAQDKYSIAKQTQLNHMQICEDSCVEFFFSPSGLLGSSYVNLEVNCCGTLHIAYGDNRHQRQFISSELAKQILCKSSISSPTKLEKNTDIQWIIEVTLPFTAIEKLIGKKINNNKWFANFYRCGGRKAPQYAVWANIPTEQPDYHRPEYFGELQFDS